jgi:hypothetical protein
MTISLKHAFQSGKADGSDSTRVQPSNWNAEHVLEMATARILGRVTASTGAAEELTAAQVYAFIASQIPAANLAAGGAGGVTGILPAANGGLGTDKMVFSGPATSQKTYTLPNISSKLHTDQAANVDKVVALSDGATPALDASLGNVFTLTAAGDRTIAVPTNPTSGQKIVIRHLASGGARTLSLNTGTGGFRFGTNVVALTQTVSGNAGDNKWDVVAYAKGY